MFRAAQLFALGMLVVASGCQRKMVYDPDPHVATDPSSIGQPYEQIRIETSDRKTITGWFCPAPKRRGTVIYSHGNGSNIGKRIPMIESLVALGLDVIVYDYHGYGDSEGKPGEKQTYRDARAVWEWTTKTRNVPPEEIVIWGRSLGGAVSLWLATEPDVKPAGVVLESTYASLVDVAAHLYPKAPVRAFLIHRYDSTDRVPDLNAPLLYAHSPDDEIVPYAIGMQLYDAAPQPKRFIQLQGKHVGTRLTADEYREPVDAFLDEVLGP